MSKLKSIWLNRIRWVIKKPSLAKDFFKYNPNGIWMNYNAVPKLLEICKNKKVFEYGSGNSSKVLKEISKEIISVENNLEWFNKTKSNSKVIFKPNKKEYIESVKDFGLFDVVIVDGDFRVECAEFAWNYLKSDGVMVIDDCMDFAPHFEGKFDFFRPGYRHVRVAGFKGTHGGYWETGFVYKGLKE